MTSEYKYTCQELQSFTLIQLAYEHFEEKIVTDENITMTESFLVEQ